MTLQMRQSFFIPTGSEILLLTYQQRRTPDNPQVCLYKLKDPNLFIEEESFLLKLPERLLHRSVSKGRTSFYRKVGRGILRHELWSRND